MSVAGKKLTNQQLWEEKARKLFEGKKIVSVRYMTKQEAEENDIEARPLCFKLDDGTIVIPLSDDEGNNGGAFQLIKKDQSYLLPVM
mgnify:FL=1|tara:strand:- start:738 stop:998 length:261 start_codon:yes stop_codon:yes gene_type:complete